MQYDNLYLHVQLRLDYTLHPFLTLIYMAESLLNAACITDHSILHTSCESDKTL